MFSKRRCLELPLIMQRSGAFYYRFFQAPNPGDILLTIIMEQFHRLSRYMLIQIIYG